MSIINVPEANPRRGAKHEHKAAAFARRYPIGTSLSTEEFDQWADGEGLLVMPPPGISKQSNDWLAHLQRRHQIKNGLNTALSHPRMNLIPGVAACAINRISHNMLEVQTVTDSVVKSKLPKAIETLTNTHRRRLIHLQQSADWDSLPPYEKVRVEEIVANIDDYANRLDYETISLNKRIERLRAHLQLALDSGNLLPSSGAVAALLAPVPEGGDPVPDEDDTGED